jgi:hypothetical protein
VPVRAIEVVTGRTSGNEGDAALVIDGHLTPVVHASSRGRQIYLDGRKPRADAQPTWMGYSAGHWEGDKLVVESSGFNDKTRSL